MHLQGPDPSLPPPPPFALSTDLDDDETDVDLADEGDEDDQGEHECTGFDGPEIDEDDEDQGDDDDGSDECPRPRPRSRALLRADTWPEGIEYLGSYPTLEAFFRAMLEPEISAGCLWILDILDYQEVQRRWESDGSRLVIEHGQVYRLGGTAQPTPEPDPAGPWMPTRGE